MPLPASAVVVDRKRVSGVDRFAFLRRDFEGENKLRMVKNHEPHQPLVYATINSQPRCRVAPATISLEQVSNTPSPAGSPTNCKDFKHPFRLWYYSNGHSLRDCTRIFNKTNPLRDYRIQHTLSPRDMTSDATSYHNTCHGGAPKLHSGSHTHTHLHVPGDRAGPRHEPARLCPTRLHLESVPGLPLRFQLRERYPPPPTPVANPVRGAVDAVERGGPARENRKRHVDVRRGKPGRDRGPRGGPSSHQPQEAASRWRGRERSSDAHGDRVRVQDSDALPPAFIFICTQRKR